MVVSTTWFTSQPASAQTGLGMALSFDGVDDQVSLTSGPALDLTNGTIELWMNPRTLAGHACLLANGGPTSAQTRYRLDLSPNALGLWNGSSYQTVPFAGTTGQWCHVAVVLSPTNAQFFVNGLAYGATTNGINLGITGTSFTIGAARNASGNFSNYFAGMLDEIRVWNVARSQMDITNHMFQPVTAAEPGLVACYRFDESSGATAYDASTNQLDGTLLNGLWRVPSYWSPALMLNGFNLLTNECHVAFGDAGAMVSASPTVIAAGGAHGLALRANGTVMAWGYNYYGQTTVPASATNVVALAAGNHYSMALKNDGVVVAWGINDSGQTTIPASATNVVALAAGGAHGLALKEDGTVVGWGANGNGQTTIPVSATNVVAIAASWAHSLALKSDGTVVTWGGSDPVPDNATNLVAVAAGVTSTSLALKRDGTVIAWGYNGYGQTAIPASATNVVAIAAGWQHSLALRRDGTVVGWGNNGSGQTTIPASATNVVAIAAGYYYSLALRRDGTIVAWGDNYSGQTTIPASVYQLNQAISVNSTLDTNTPSVYTLIYSTTNALGAVGSATRIVVVADTRPPVLALLGSNPFLHALGTPFTDPGATATDLCTGDLTGSIGITNAVNSSLTGSYTNTYTVTDAVGNTAQITRRILVGVPLAITLPASGLLNGAATLNGTVNPNGVATTAWFEWGSGLSYDNTTPPVAIETGIVPMPLNAGLTELTPGVTYRYRLVASNSVAVSRGATQAFWSPAVVLTGPNPLTNECHVPLVDLGAKASASPVALAAGGDHSLALRRDGTVAAWGRNDLGQTAIPAGATNVVALAAGSSHSLAIKDDGMVIAWGYNGYGQTTIPTSATNVVAIAAGHSHSLALRGNGTIIAWGRNNFGQTAIPAGATNVVALATGSSHSLALRGDGTVVTWGYNGYGQTTIPANATNLVAVAAGGDYSLALKSEGIVVAWGRNDLGQTTTPVGVTNVVALAAGSAHSLVLRGDGTVVAWGYNGYGQTTIPANATNLVAIAAGGDHSLALRRDGTVVAWGRNNFGQTMTPAGLSTLNLALSVSGTVDISAPGVYLLTYSTTNALGAVGSATRMAVVVDTESPVLALLGDNPLLHALGAAFIDPGATATDLCAGDLGGSIGITNTVNSSLTGSYTNTYTVTDASGNMTQTNRVVTVFLPPPTFTSHSMLAPNQFQLQATGTAGLSYTLQTSTNLVNWVDYTNVVANLGGTIDCLIDVSPNTPARFYRLKWP